MLIGVSLWFQTSGIQGVIGHSLSTMIWMELGIRDIDWVWVVCLGWNIWLESRRCGWVQRCQIWIDVVDMYGGREYDIYFWNRGKIFGGVICSLPSIGLSSPKIKSIISKWNYFLFRLYIITRDTFYTI